MSIAERMAVLAGGRNMTMARPSKEQQQQIERLEEVLKCSRREYRKRQRERQYSDEKAKRGGRLSPLTGDDYTHQHGRQTRSLRCSPLGQDLLGAMAGCSRLGTAIVLTEFAQDRSSQHAALEELYHRTLDLFIVMDWKTRDQDKGKDIRRSMCRLALFEALHPRCDKCKGRKEGPRGGHCRACGGTGALRISDTDRAIALGVTQKSFWKTHKARYLAVKKMVFDEKQETLEAMAEALYG